MKLLHISIPKNGGTHIANSLRSNFAEDECLFVEEHNVTLGHFLENAETITSRHKFVGGHIPFALARPYADKFDLIISSYREPWRRAWSTFRFVTSRMAEWRYLQPEASADAAEKFSTFIDRYFIANVATRNMQCGYLGDANLPHAALANIHAYNITMLACSSLDAGLQGWARHNDLDCDTKTISNETPADGIGLAHGDEPAIDQKIFDWFDGDYELYEELSRQAAGF